MGKGPEMNTLKTLGMLWAVLLLAACGSMDAALSNRIGCTVDGKRAYSVSQWGPLGVTATVHADDAAAVCAGRAAAAPASAPKPGA